MSTKFELRLTIIAKIRRIFFDFSAKICYNKMYGGRDGINGRVNDE